MPFVQFSFSFVIMNLTNYRFAENITERGVTVTKDLYTIGETAALLGVSTQTLRFYDKKGILSPVYTDPDTGYRYYSYRQFHIIDRIKYLQGFGLPLESIETIIKDGTVDGLLPFLDIQRKKCNEEIKKMQEQVKDIEWYINYFTYLKDSDDEKYLYRVHENKRYILEVPCYDTDELSDMEIRLAAARSLPQFIKLPCRRQYGYKVDFDGLLDRKFKPYSYFVYLRKEPDFEAANFDVLPEGDYICIRTKILKENWDTEILKSYFEGCHKPKIAIALEFEDNLVDWSNAVYEIQILL